MKTDLLNFAHSSAEQIQNLIELAVTIKRSPRDFSQALSGKSVVGIFEKPSLRTRVSFDIGIQKLGGHFLYLDSNKDNLAGREESKDMASNLSCWADAIVARVYQHDTLETLAEHASVPVVNALCDLYHPCQGLADFQTVYEAFGYVKGVKISYIGDGNNVAHSLLIVGAKLGAHVRIVTPDGYAPNPDIVSTAQQFASHNGGSVEITTDINAVSDADILYTDTWQSMGDSTPLDELAKVFMPYQINQQLLDRSGAQYVLHCQPAHRDYEISSEVMDGEQSLLMQQAENRMYAQSAILMTLLSDEKE